MIEIKKEVIWMCGCGAENKVEYATDKHRLVCSKCQAIYLVTGLHIDGSPFVTRVAS